MKIRFAMSAALMLMTLSGGISADGSTALMPRLYFEIGGGEPVRTPVTVEALIDLPVSDPFKEALSCDLWDVKHAGDLDLYLDMVEEHLTGQIDQLGQQILLNIETFVEGAIVGVLQRAMPGLYDYSQNVHSQLSAKIQVARQSCEAVATRTRQSSNSLREWLELSDLQKWKEVLGASVGADGSISFTGESVISGEEQVAMNQGTTSVPWFDGDRGGSDDPAIKLVHNSVSVGYALVSGQTPDIGVVITDTSAVSSTDPLSGDTITSTNRLGDLWATSALAVDWAHKVIGEQSISFCPGCTSRRQSGAGLLAAYHDERETLSLQWNRILGSYSTSRPTVATMQSVSGGGVNYHVDVVDALMEMHVQDRAVFVDRLIADTALSLTVERGMALRRLLRVASQTPVVSAYEHVEEELDRFQEELKTELEELKWELDLQSAVSSKVAGSILAYRDSARQSSGLITRGSSVSATTVSDVVMQQGDPIQIQDIE